MTEDQRRYRGDWLIEALTAHLRGQQAWQKANGNPPGLKRPYPGRYNPATGLWEPPERGHQGFDPPLHALVRIPTERDINYPGEVVWITLRWVDDIRAKLHMIGAWQAMIDYARGDDSRSIAYYHPREKRVVWGPHDKRMRDACLLISDRTAYQPIKGTEQLTDALA